jgi:hypothetical protein
VDGCLCRALQWCPVVRVVERPVISLRWYVPPGIGPIDRNLKVLLWHICSKLVGARHLGSSRLLLIPLCIRHRHRLLVAPLRRRYLLETVKGGGGACHGNPLMGCGAINGGPLGCCGAKGIRGGTFKLHSFAFVA